MWLTAFKIFSRAWPFLFFSKFAKKEMRSMQWNSGIAREQRDSIMENQQLFREDNPRSLGFTLKVETILVMIT